MARFDNSIDRDPPSATLPSDWTFRKGDVIQNQVSSNATTGITNQVIIATSTSGLTSVGNISWDAPGSYSDGEILSLVRFNSFNSISNFLLLGIVRGTSTGTDFTFSCLTLVSCSSIAGNVLKLVNFINGTTSEMTPASSISFASAVDTWYWARLNFQSSIYKGKVWALGTTEPGSFQVTAGATSLSTGFVGNTFDGDGTIGKKIAWFSAATGTDTAPDWAYEGVNVTTLSADTFTELFPNTKVSGY